MSSTCLNVIDAQVPNNPVITQVVAPNQHAIYTHHPVFRTTGTPQKSTGYSKEPVTATSDVAKCSSCNAETFVGIAMATVVANSQDHQYDQGNSRAAVTVSGTIAIPCNHSENFSVGDFITFDGSSTNASIVGIPDEYKCAMPVKVTEATQKPVGIVVDVMPKPRQEITVLLRPDIASSLAQNTATATSTKESTTPKPGPKAKADTKASDLWKTWEAMTSAERQDDEQFTQASQGIKNCLTKLKRDKRYAPEGSIFDDNTDTAETTECIAAAGLCLTSERFLDRTGDGAISTDNEFKDIIVKLLNHSELLNQWDAAKKLLLDISNEYEPSDWSKQSAKWKEVFNAFPAKIIEQIQELVTAGKEEVKTLYQVMLRTIKDSKDTSVTKFAIAIYTALTTFMNACVNIKEATAARMEPSVTVVYPTGATHAPMEGGARAVPKPSKVARKKRSGRPRRKPPTTTEIQDNPLL